MTGRAGTGPEEPAPSVVRERVRREHARLRSALADADSLAGALAAGRSGAVDALRQRVRDLRDALFAQIDLEDRILAPALRETPGFGEAREQQLLAHHAVQRDRVRAALDVLGRWEPSPSEIGRRVQTLIADICLDMADEEDVLLNANLLKDDPIDVSFTG